MKFGSKKENIDRFTLLKYNFKKVISFQNGSQNNFLILRNNAKDLSEFQWKSAHAPKKELPKDFL